MLTTCFALGPRYASVMLEAEWFGAKSIGLDIGDWSVVDDLGVDVNSSDPEFYH